MNPQETVLLSLEARAVELFKERRHNTFAIGDLYIEAEKALGDGNGIVIFHEKDMHPARLNTLKCVCKKFPPFIRDMYPALSFGHFEEVRSLVPEEVLLAARLLAQAQNNRWSRDTLREARQEAQGKTSDTQLPQSCIASNLFFHLGIPDNATLQYTVKGNKITLEIIEAIKDK